MNCWQFARSRALVTAVGRFAAPIATKHAPCTVAAHRGPSHPSGVPARWMSSASTPPSVDGGDAVRRDDSTSPFNPDTALAELQGQRESLYIPDPLRPLEKKYYWMLKMMRVFSNKAKIGQQAEDVFRSAEEQATQDCFFDALGLKHDFMTEHALVTLHVWILHNRFKVDYDGPGVFCGRRMQEQMFEHFWFDCTLKIRNVGVPEMRVNKQLENMQKISFRDMQRYDEAILKEDDDNMALSAVLWDQVFQGEADAPTENVLLLADYTRREVYNIMTVPKEDLYRGWIPWGPAVGETPDDRLARQRALFEGEWREGIHADGRMYFFHTTTRERQWEVPEGLYNKRRYALTKHLERIELEKNGTLSSGDSKPELTDGSSKE